MKRAKCRRKPCRARRLRGAPAADCWDLVDAVRKATKRYQDAEDRIYIKQRYFGEEKRVAIKKLEAQKTKLDALNARYVELGC